MKKAVLSLLLAFFLCVTAFYITSRADFGDFGGDSDYGGWDSGNSDDWDWDWGTDDNDYDYGGWNSAGSYHSSYTSDYEVSDTTKMILGAVFLALLVGGAAFGIVKLVKGIGNLAGKMRTKNMPQQPPQQQQRQKKQWQPAQRRPGGTPLPRGATPTGSAELKPIADFRKVDPGFSPESLKEQLSNRYVQFQNAWQDKDLSILRPYLTDTLYAQMDRQLENNYRKTHQTNRVERIAVLDVRLMGWKQSAGEDQIIARLKTRIVDYVVDDATGNVVRGSNTVEKFMEYEWTLTRAAGVITGETDGLTVHNCPNCGAVLNINQTARCEYCGSVVTVQAHDWAVSNIKGLSQRTGR